MEPITLTFGRDLTEQEVVAMVDELKGNKTRKYESPVDAAEEARLLSQRLLHGDYSPELAGRVAAHLDLLADLIDKLEGRR